MNKKINKITTSVLSYFMSNYVKRYLQLPYISSELPECTFNNKMLLYIHVPFCEMLCPYCSFYKVLYNEDKYNFYYIHIKQELLHVKALGYDFNRLVIGGGTPFINEDKLLDIINFTKTLFSIKHISCETDPKHIKKETVVKFKDSIDRLSIGVQTFNDNLLKNIGRLEKFGHAKEIYKKIENIIGILPTISIDLIFNFPSQSKQELIYDLNTILKLLPEQVSFYPLMVSSVVKNSVKNRLGEFSLKNEYDYFNTIKKSLNNEYPVKNGWSFSKHRDIILDEYVVDNENYIGVGPGSFSFIDGTLYANEFDLSRYIKSVKHSGSAITKKQIFGKKSQMYYQLMINLFAGDMHKDKFFNIFGENIDKALKLELFMLNKLGIIKKYKNRITTTKFGDYIFVMLMKEFYIGMDRIRLQSKTKLE